MALRWRFLLASGLAAISPVAAFAQVSASPSTVATAGEPILAEYEAGRFATACALYGSGGPEKTGLDAATYHNTGAIALLGCGATGEAEAAIERASAALGSGSTPGMRHIVASNRALILGRRGRWDDAATVIESILAERTAAAGDAHPATISALANLAAVRWRQSRLAEAETLFADAAGRAGSMSGGKPALLAVTAMNRLTSQSLTMQPDEALKSAQAARAALSGALADSHPLALRRTRVGPGGGRGHELAGRARCGEAPRCDLAGRDRSA